SNNAGDQIRVLTAVPEPTSIILICSGLSLLCRRICRAL
ncbi:MAG: PEP-CTERM sorting domain-containing protein, partial [Deltaproteobacteria bacterium]|nr:PEP-CTERM sorting domain-containing protein [Deltaproteobacteria bacterium]